MAAEEAEVEEEEEGAGVRAGDMGRGMPEAPRLRGRGRVRFPDSAGETQREPGAGDGDLHLCTAWCCGGCIC